MYMYIYMTKNSSSATYAVRIIQIWYFLVQRCPVVIKFRVNRGSTVFQIQYHVLNTFNALL